MITYTTNQLINVSVPAGSTSIIPLFSNALPSTEQALRNAGERVICNRYLKSLRAYISIASIPPVALPKFDELESNYERNLKIREVEWKGARKLLRLLYKSGSGEWSERGILSLTNREPVPYFDANVLDFFTEGLAVELGEADQLGVAAKDVGFGLLSTSDSVRFYGNLVTEFFINESISQNAMSSILFLGEQNSPQSINLSQFNLISIDSFRINQGSGFNGYNGYIIPTGMAGFYRLSSFINIDAVGGEITGYIYWLLGFRINGQLKSCSHCTGNLSNIIQSWQLEYIYLNEGDLIQSTIYPLMNGATSGISNLSEIKPYLKIEKIG